MENSVESNDPDVLKAEIARLLARLEDRERRVQELAGEVCALLLQLEAAP